MYTQDTIVAAATAPAPAGIGVIRVSGPGTQVAAIASAVFERTTVDGDWRTHRLYHGRVLDADGGRLDEGLAVLMRAPHSYTGEDVLELHCHGSPVVLRRVVECLLRLGARAAEPGEFTKRAFLNGKLDLAQAEAVVDLVEASTAESAARAVDQLFGHLSSHLNDLREKLIRVRAHLEAEIDFSDEDIAPDPRRSLGDLHGAIETVRRLLATFAHGRLLREGLRVTIVGRPNAGKSTLLNALLGEERAIVTAVPGTTRDLIEERADFDGVPVVLQDTAGLRETPDGVERVGVERALHAAASADVVVLVIDSSMAPSEPEERLDGRRVVVALNKSDLPRAWAEDDVAALARRFPVVELSAKEGRGLADLRSLVVESVAGAPADGTPVLTRSRQRDALEKALDCLTRAYEAFTQRVPADLVAVDLQAALDHIGSVTGSVSSEDVLDVIFRDFCIGK